MCFLDTNQGFRAALEFIGSGPIPFFRGIQGLGANTS